jgi:hypothetical protein
MDTSSLVYPFFFRPFVEFVLVIIQVWECSPGKELTWNLLSLFTSSGMLFLEVSLLAFLLQGNNASGVEALTRIFGISGIIVGFDVLLKVILLFFTTNFTVFLVFTVYV